MDAEGSNRQPGLVFARLGKELSATTNAEEAAEIILQAADILIGWDAGYLVLYDPEQSDRTRPLLMMDLINGKRIKLADDVLNRPSENMFKAIRHDGYMNLYEGQFERENSLTFGDRSRRTLSQLFVPVKSHRRVIGVLSIQSYRKNEYDQNSLEIFKALSNHCAGALERIWAQEQVVSLSERRNILYKASQAISASLDLEQVCNVIHKAVEQVMPCDDFIIDGYDENSNEIFPLYIVVSQDGRIINAERYYADHGLSGAIVHTGKSFHFNNIEERDKSGIKFVLIGTEDKTQSILAAPLWLHGKVVGMISAQSYKPHAYTHDDLELLEMLAPQAAIAMENARLFAQVQELADTDSLTGLLTRRKFYELTESQFPGLKSENKPFCVILLDADNFKMINDRYGHKVGDAVLQIMAAELTANIREKDILCRFGGEEFLLALPETTIETALQISGRLCKALEQADLTKAREFYLTATGANPDFKALKVTASVGAAEYDPSCSHFDILIDRADRAMYAAKKDGKNRVKVWSQNLQSV